jgi:hypothetical protein
MQLPHFLLLAGALGAAAHPSGHAHLHRSAHAKREEPGFVKAIRKPIPIPAATSQAPEPTPTVADSPAVKVAAVVDEVTDAVFKAFCGSSSSKAKRVTMDQILYKGNTGTNNGCTWNSNIMEVANSLADKYDNVQKYTNVASEPYQVICANKMGADGQNTGSFEVPGQNPLIFMLQPGETKTVVADTDTQGICAFAPKKVPLTIHSQYAGVWAEFDFSSKPNQGWSGADCSSLVAQAYGMDVPGCRMSHGGVNSDILPGGIGTNAYTIGMEKLDGIGLNIIPGKTVIEVKVGFSG